MSRSSVRAARWRWPLNLPKRTALAVTLQYLGRIDESLAHHRRAIALKPYDAGLHSNLLYMLNFLPGWEPAAIFAEHRAWGRRHADPLTAQAAPHTNDRSTDRRLRVGYVSPHFHAHAVNFFIEPILQAHDHQRFEIYCYADVSQPDETTARLRGFADVWRDVGGMNEAQLAEIVRRDQIDILVDLTGHIAGGRRMLTFARKPAPVQVTYVGYQNTTGMEAMDYRVTDAYADLPGVTDAWHSERLVRLPGTFFCYQPAANAPAVGPLPADVNGYVTFGSFNNYTKVTPAVLTAWAKILGRVSGSRLILQVDVTPSLERMIAETFAGLGVSSERIELVARQSPSAFRELISRADIALDPFPFNGHTTTCDCLWQGVLVVTLSGQTYVQRFGGSGLATLGLQELIAGSADEYVEIAVALAADRRRLARLRTALRERMAASPLMDFDGFTCHLEAAYRQMWQRWCDVQGREVRAAGPQSALAAFERGHALLLAGRADQALPEFQEALRCDPNFARALFGAGTALLVMQRVDESIAHYQHLLQLMPNHADACSNLAVAFSELRRHDEAIEYCRRAIAIEPNYALAHDNLAGSLQMNGRLDESIEHHRRAIAAEPTSPQMHSNLLYALNYHPGYDAAAIFAEHRAWAVRHADPLLAASAPHLNDPAPERPLRVGYVSPHFKQHAVNYFVEPLLAAHDLRRVELFCYSDVRQGDETTNRLRGYAAQWRDIAALDDQGLAELVRRDRIDVLVDLTGHIAGGGRLLAFARKPAPIQVTYIGYQNTTGMRAMDYRLTDAYADPLGLTDAFYTEQLVRLPRTFFCYQPLAGAGRVTVAGAVAGIRDIHLGQSVRQSHPPGTGGLGGNTQGSGPLAAVRLGRHAAVAAALSYGDLCRGGNRPGSTGAREFLALGQISRVNLLGRHRARSLSIQRAHDHLRLFVARRAGCHPFGQRLSLALRRQRPGDARSDGADHHVGRRVHRVGRGPGERYRSVGEAVRHTARAHGRLGASGLQGVCRRRGSRLSPDVARLVQSTSSALKRLAQLSKASSSAPSCSSHQRSSIRASSLAIDVISWCSRSASAGSVLSSNWALSWRLRSSSRAIERSSAATSLRCSRWRCSRSLRSWLPWRGAACALPGDALAASSRSPSSISWLT